MVSYKVEICLKKKPTRAQIFRYFPYESRNKDGHIAVFKQPRFHTYQ